jgi:phage terminase small subunit
MRAPAGLTQAARRAWREAVATLQLLDRDPGIQMGRLRVYASAVARLEELEAAWRADGAVMHAKGSRDQIVTHPDLVEMRALAEHVDELADKLFGVPAPRMGGWQRGNARSPDRQFRPPRRSKNVVPLPTVDKMLADAERRRNA